MRISQGNGPPCAKAFVGPLPEGLRGYTFKTDVVPSGTRFFHGIEGRVWYEDREGVFDVQGQRGLVGIKIEVVNVWL